MLAREFYYTTRKKNLSSGFPGGQSNGTLIEIFVPEIGEEKE